MYPKVDWTKLGPTIGGLTLFVTLLVVFMLAAYDEWLIPSTTQKPWTHIMRDNPWVLPTIAIPVLAASAWGIPFFYRGRVLLVVATGLIFFLAGHVYW